MIGFLIGVGLGFLLGKFGGDLLDMLGLGADPVASAMNEVKADVKKADEDIKKDV